MNNKQLKKAKVHDELGKFHLGISRFGEISGTMDIDKINAFLNQQGEDALFEEIIYKQILTTKENTTTIAVDVAFNKLTYLYT